MKRIKLSLGKVALVDDSDYEELSQWSWHARRGRGTGWYAFGRPWKGDRERGPIALHRFLFNPTAGEQIDHVNGNGLDNRRRNLRICTGSQNLGNTRKRRSSPNRYKGVSRDGRLKSRQWRAVIAGRGKYRHLGYFLTEEEAARAYDKAAEDVYGKFARLNFPSEVDFST